MPTDRLPHEKPRTTADLVVSNPHLPLVLAYLEKLHVRRRIEAESELLGLTLVQVGIKNAVDRTAAALVVTAPERSPDELGEERPDKLVDRILWALRKLMKHEYGFFPTIGKNRTLGRTHGVGWVIHGGGGPPRMLKADATLPEPRSTGPGRGARVGVIDTALFPHPWLAGGWSARYSDTLRLQQPTYADGHSTFVTGLILSQAPGATVDVRQLLDEDGTATSWDAAERIVELGRSGLDVLNLSFACYTEDDKPPLVLATAIDRLDPDLVIVAAAGNFGAVTEAKLAKGETLLDAQRRPAWPAALDDVIAVGAVDHDGLRSRFSPDAPWVDIHAPGEDIFSTYLQLENDRRYPKYAAGWAKWNGTSFAAALISGAVAAGVDPGRVSGREAMRDIMRSLAASKAAPVGKTHAKALPLRVWRA